MVIHWLRQLLLLPLQVLKAVLLWCKVVKHCLCSTKMMTKAIIYKMGTKNHICGLVVVLSAIGLSQFSHANEQKTLVLLIDLSPALCSLDETRSKLRQCTDGYSLTVSGLRAEPMAENAPCSHASANLPPLQDKVVSRIMPDAVLKDKAWQQYGACLNVPKTQYFRLIINLANRLKLPKELSTGESYRVNKPKFVAKVTGLNHQMTSSSLRLTCRDDSKQQQTLLTQMQVCYSQDGSYSSCPVTILDSCSNQFYIRGLP